MASTQRVFAIPELLEKIVLHIPERELLLSQRVNHTFRNVIKHSPQLQRKLFYTADVYREGDELSELKWNPLLKFFYPHLGGASERILYVTWQRHQRWRQANHNNLLSLNDFIDACVPELDYKAFEKADYPTASWKTMYFTQPAVSKMAIDNHIIWDEPGCPRRLKSYIGPEKLSITHYRTLKASWTWVSMLKTP